MNEVLHPIRTIRALVGRWIWGPDYSGSSDPKRDAAQPTPLSTPLFGGVLEQDWHGQTPRLGIHPEHPNV